MSYCVKVKLEDVEKALADVRPGHRLVAVLAHYGCPPDEYAEWERSQKLFGPPDPGVIRLGREAPVYQMRDLYFEEVTEGPTFQFDQFGALKVRLTP